MDKIKYINPESQFSEIGEINITSQESTVEDIYDSCYSNLGKNSNQMKLVFMNRNNLIYQLLFDGHLETWMKYYHNQYLAKDHPEDLDLKCSDIDMIVSILSVISNGMFEDFESIDDTEPSENILGNIYEKVKRLKDSPSLYPEQVADDNITKWYQTNYPNINFWEDIYTKNSENINQELTAIMKEKIKEEILRHNSYLRYTNLSKHQDFVFELCLPEIKKLAESKWNPSVQK